MIRSISGGDPAFIKKMILLFIETVPQNVKELVDSCRSQNWEQVSKMAHKLKSTVDSMGIKSIHDDIRRVEAQAKAREDLEALPQKIEQVEAVISLCIRQLRKEVQ
jgi:HPt (histidine-containing phosphotransfer) domain-containing protein